VVAIVDETFCGHTHKHTNTHTDKHSSDFISVQCHELHWTDNNYTHNEHLVLCGECKVNVFVCAQTNQVKIPI